MSFILLLFSFATVSARNVCADELIERLSGKIEVRKIVWVKTDKRAPTRDCVYSPEVFEMLDVAPRLLFCEGERADERERRAMNAAKEYCGAEVVEWRRNCTGDAQALLEREFKSEVRADYSPADTAVVYDRARFAFPADDIDGVVLDVCRLYTFQCHVEVYFKEDAADVDNVAYHAVMHALAYPRHC